MTLMMQVTGDGWDGRLAMVVTTDISVYIEPAARATGDDALLLSCL
jgi:hypothetical protein